MNDSVINNGFKKLKQVEDKFDNNQSSGLPEYLFEQLAVLQTQTNEGIVRLLDLAAFNMSELAMRRGSSRIDRLTAITLIAALKFILSEHQELSNDSIIERIKMAEENLEKTRPIGYVKPTEESE